MQLQIKTKQGKCLNGRILREFPHNHYVWVVTVLWIDSLIPHVVQLAVFHVGLCGIAEEPHTLFVAPLLRKVPIGLGTNNSQHIDKN